MTEIIEPGLENALKNHKERMNSLYAEIIANPYRAAKAGISIIIRALSVIGRRLYSGVREILATSALDGA